MDELSSSERERYARHLLLPEIGTSGQLRLSQATVAVVGAGGLGCPALQYLAAAGVGTIRIIDNDTVDRSNLQRQILYSDADVQLLKPLLQRLSPFLSPLLESNHRWAVARGEERLALELLGGRASSDEARRTVLSLWLWKRCRQTR